MVLRFIHHSSSRLQFKSSVFKNCYVFRPSESKHIAPPNAEERLKSLKSAERAVAIFAGVSLILGYFALKKGFADMASKKDSLPRPLVIAGPSGSGKSTLLRKLLNEFPDQFGFSVSHTSRKPRPGEKNGKEYHFCTREEFEKKVENGEFIETAEYSNNLYGTSKKAVSDVCSQRRVCVLDIDMQGVRSIKETDLNPVYVVIKPPSMDELKQRLQNRKTETEESLKRRLHVAKEELEYAEKPGVFDYSIVNTTVDKAYEQLQDIVIKELRLQKSTTK